MVLLKLHFLINPSCTLLKVSISIAFNQCVTVRVSESFHDTARVTSVFAIMIIAINAVH